MLRLRRLLQLQLHINLSRKASSLVSSNPHRNPSTAFSIYLRERGLSLSKEAKTKKNPDGTDKSNLYEFVHPDNKRTVILDLDQVEPFTPEFALLPLKFRIRVEHKYLFKVLQERQKSTYEGLLPPERGDDDSSRKEPDTELVKKCLDEYIRKRRHKTDVPPSQPTLNRYLNLARAKVLKDERKLEQDIKVVSAQPKLSWGEQWHRRGEYQESVLKTLAAKQIGQYNPYRDLKYPVKPRNVTVEQLLAAGCHIGQHKSNCHPAMKPFITGTWENLDIINLDYTLAHLRRACAIVREVSFRHGRILLAGTRKGHKKILINAAERMGAYLIYKKWIPGTITNAHNVLYRGRLKEMPTPIRKYASKSVLEELATKPLWDKETVARFVWDHHSGQWIMSDDRVPDFKDWKGKFRAGRVSDQDRDRGKSSTKFGPDELVAERDPTAVESASVAAANDAHTNRDDVVKRIENRARDRGDLADWMAWAKFASIVQSVSDQYTDILTQPHQSFHSQLPALSVETVNHYIPDHKDDWYKRELEAENEEVRRRHLIADATGDRNPFEMFKMDVFLKQSGYRGRVRGEYIHHRVKNVATDGITAYQNVRVFRDGSALVNGRRVDRFGAPITQFSDGSYRTGGKVYDIDGMRYDAKKDALVFSDGSVLKFDGQGDERKLVVVIGSQVFDVTSTVVGSAEKREILEKAEDLLQQGSEPRIREHMPYVEEILGGATLDIKYEMIRSQPGNLVDDEDEDDKKGTEDQMVSGDEMFDIGDTVEARSLDELIENSSELPAWQKRTWGVTEPLQPAETPFDNMYASINPTVQPELVILLNPRENRMAIHEATNHQIPTIGIIDTDCDPRKVTYSIPANDDSLRSVEYIAGVLSRAGEEGMIHRTRYTEQLEFLKERAKFFLEESWKDLDSLGNGEDDNEAAQEARNSVIKKYKDWYNLDPENLNKNILRKLALQHIVMGQNEIKRLYADTTGWSMQEFLDQVKTSTQFPGTPTTVLEDMARIQMTKARHVWAEARDKVDQRSGRLYPDESPIDSQT